MQQKKNFINDTQKLKLNNLRIIRNPLTHIKGIKNKNLATTTSLGKSESSIMHKLLELSPDMKEHISESVLEKDAKLAISMSKLYYEIFC